MSSRKALRAEGTPGPFGFGFWVVLPVAVAAVFLVWTRVSTLATGYALARTRTALVQAREEQRVLEVERNALRSAERLQSMAKQRFQLRPPTKDQVVKP